MTYDFFQPCVQENWGSSKWSSKSGFDHISCPGLIPPPPTKSPDSPTTKPSQSPSQSFSNATTLLSLQFPDKTKTNNNFNLGAKQKSYTNFASIKNNNANFGTKRNSYANFETDLLGNETSGVQYGSSVLKQSLISPMSPKEEQRLLFTNHGPKFLPSGISDTKKTFHQQVNLHFV